MARFDDLQEHVVMEILLRLPADSLVQFKCVSKSSYALITDPAFVAKHLHYTKKKSQYESLLFGRHCGEINGYRLSLLPSFVDNGENDIIRPVVEDLNVPLTEYGDARITEWANICHCDGMVCLQSEDFWNPIDIMVCNPELQEFKVLPRLKNAEKMCHRLIGFEYNSIANDYKIVSYDGVDVQIHTLGTESWREINISQDIPMPSQYGYLNSNGVCYWAMTTNSSTRKSVVLCFDMRDETFHVVPFSNEATNFEDVSCAMWNGKFSLFLNSSKADDYRVENPKFHSTFEMWVMDFDTFKSVNGGCPWTKHLVIGPLGPFEGPLTPIKFSNDDELILWTGRSRKFRAYNLHTQKVRSIETDGDTLFICCLYVKSLVSIKGTGVSTRELKRNGEDGKDEEKSTAVVT